MSGAINMGSSQINSLANPSTGTDAVNKQWFDYGVEDISNALGYINVSGNILTSNSLLTITKSTGIMFGYNINIPGDDTNPH